MNKHLKLICALFLSIIFFSPTVGKVFAQDDAKPKKLSREAKKARQDSLSLLKEMKGIIENDYYDSTYHGIDLDAKYEAAKERIKTLEYNWQMFRVLVQFAMDFNDSHTRFNLPPRSDFFDYGFSMADVRRQLFNNQREKRQ